MSSAAPFPRDPEPTRPRSFTASCTPKLLLNLHHPESALANDALRRLLGKPPRSEGGLTLATCCTPEEIRSIVTELGSTGFLRSRELELRNASGEPVVCLVSGEVLDDSVDEAIVVLHDISERKRTEAALRESECRFRQLAENIREVFWIIDPTIPRTLYVSPAYETVWGRSCEALYENPLDWLEGLHPDDRPRLEEATGKFRLGAGYDETYRVVQTDGATRWVRDRAFPLRDPAGNAYRVVGVAEDVTGQKLLEHQVVRSQRLEAVGTLAAGVAHDLNNILTPISVAAGMLKGQLHNASDVELAAMIETSAVRGGDIVKQLLAFSRGIESARGPVQPRHILREVRKLIAETFPRNVEIRLAAPNDLWPIDADATQLHQVVLNLCVNARDAMPEGGTLFLAASNEELDAHDPRLEPNQAPGRFVAFSVADTGTGIPPDVLPHIFDPFYTTKAEGLGTGLGLSTVLGIVRSHGGFLKADTEIGQGTTFRVYWPAQQNLATEPQPLPMPTVSGTGELVLVVDDEKTVRTAVQMCLRADGYRVLTAPDGAAALALFLKHRHEIDLVLTDVMMPVMDGWRLAWEIRAIGDRIPIVASSGLESPRAPSAGLISRLLPKPYDMRELLHVVAAVLASHPRRWRR